MTLQTRRLTYEDYLNGPEIRERHDIMDGEINMAPAPSIEHQEILGQLYFVLRQYVTEHDLGKVLFAPVDVLIQREPLRTRQPDLLFVSKERSGIVSTIVEGAPDLVVEILSPGNTRREVEEKLSDYARLGVRECWLISPEGRTVEVLALADDAWRRAALHGIGDDIQSEVLEGVEVGVSQLFE